jgi:hypothetical protein
MCGRMPFSISNLIDLVITTRTTSVAGRRCCLHSSYRSRFASSICTFRLRLVSSSDALLSKELRKETESATQPLFLISFGLFFSWILFPLCTTRQLHRPLDDCTERFHLAGRSHKSHRKLPWLQTIHFTPKNYFSPTGFRLHFLFLPSNCVNKRIFRLANEIRFLVLLSTLVVSKWTLRRKISGSKRSKMR